MKATELIKALQEEVNAKGDKEIVIAANRHSYRDVKLVTKDDTTTLALFDRFRIDGDEQSTETFGDCADSPAVRNPRIRRVYPSECETC